MLQKLEHVNVRTSNLEEMIKWYVEVLDMVNGDRPDFGFAGAWLYVGDTPAVHLVEVTEDLKSIEPKIEHFAFGATGVKEFLAKLDDRDIAYSLATVRNLPIVQVNVSDPDDNHIHIDFPIEEADGLL
ncbi:MAG: VOC family protein [Pseudomonadota bacterium]